MKHTRDASITKATEAQYVEDTTNDKSSGSGSPPHYNNPLEKVRSKHDIDIDSMDPEERARREKKLLRRLDVKLIPWLCLLYLTSFLDRTNIGMFSFCVCGF
jgi:hypothetical protein